MVGKKMRTIIIVVSIFLCGCSTIKTIGESTDTFAVCKFMDISTTAYALRTGLFVEKNPLVAGLLSHGYLPLIAISIGIWYALDRMQNKTATLAANAVTCPIAAHNLFLILK